MAQSNNVLVEVKDVKKEFVTSKSLLGKPQKLSMQ